MGPMVQPVSVHFDVIWQNWALDQQNRVSQGKEESSEDYFIHKHGLILLNGTNTAEITGTAPVPNLNDCLISEGTQVNPS